VSCRVDDLAEVLPDWNRRRWLATGVLSGLTKNEPLDVTIPDTTSHTMSSESARRSGRVSRVGNVRRMERAIERAGSGFWHVSKDGQIKRMRLYSLAA